MTDEIGPTLNQGYWKNVKGRDSSSQAQANLALFRKAAKNALINEKDKVLDVGCGFGTFAGIIDKDFHAKSVTGLNICTDQVASCTKHFGSNSVQFVRGSATAMPFTSNEFDKVVSVEAAFHFNSRESFLNEAFRVLKPSGVFSLVDVVLPPPENVFQRFLAWLVQRTLQVPEQNFCNTSDYLRMVKEAGFEIEASKSINEHVKSPFVNHVTSLRPMLTLIRHQSLMFLVCGIAWLVYPWDYIIIRARK
jgi:microcystin synthetase protein McyJ